jgi:hypothetical protein
MIGTNYAVCHLQKSSGNDSGMSQHIERKDAKGNRYVPDNADSTRTHLNRELIKFPPGVSCRSAAIQHRINHAGLSRKVGKNQVHAIRIMLTGSHERMIQLEQSGNLDKWIAANLDWLRATFGQENVVSCVLHMDEHTPHLHATVVPIVTAERKRREREGERKYSAKSGPRLSVTDVMSRAKLHEYQSTYGAAMKTFGLQRGIVSSTANHLSRQQYNAKTIHEQEQKMDKLQEDVEALQAQAMAARQEYEESKSGIIAKGLSWIGCGELSKARKTIKEKESEIDKLSKQLSATDKQIAMMKAANEKQITEAKDSYKREISSAIARAEKAERTSADKDRIIEQLDRQVNPHRYQLSSGAELSDMRFFNPNPYTYTLKIWTKVGELEHNAVAYLSNNDSRLTAYRNGELTDHELVNELFQSDEQVNAEQSRLLESAIELLSGGPAQAHVGTGGGGSTASDSRWDGKTRDDFRPKRR